LPGYGVTEKKTHSSSIPEDVAVKVRKQLKGASEAEAAAEAAAKTESQAKEAAAKAARNRPPAAAAPAAVAPAPAASGWTGFYVGADAGLSATDAKWTATNFVQQLLVAGVPIGTTTGLNPTLVSQEPLNMQSARLGGYLGYNWQFAPRWVVGIEGDWGSAKRITTQAGFLPGFSGIFFPLVPGDSASVRTTWDASARGRLGFLPTPSLMV